MALTRLARRDADDPTPPRVLDERAAGEAPLFCQIEALETAIYLTECATKQGDAWIANELQELADEQNPGLYRTAFKMATGTGKTVVMAMLIAWHMLQALSLIRGLRGGSPT